MVSTIEKSKPAIPNTPALLHQVPEACRMLGIGRSTLYELMSAGRLKSVTIGRRRLVPASEIERFAGELTKGAT
jgi:excisionase family DNA binding protein